MSAIHAFEGRRPLYQAMAEKLSAGIQQGAYPVGTMLPTEAELCERYKVSRSTIREALRLLLQLGMVSRRQGIGTRVERDTVVQHYVQRLGGIPDLWQYVKETRRKVLRVADVAAADAEVPLPGDPRARWRVLEGVRFADARAKPIAWTRICIAPPYAAVTDARERDDVPIYSLVERRYGLTTRTVRQEIAAVPIAREVAALLRVPPGSPGLSIVREYASTDGEVFEVTLSVHPGERYRYTMQLDLEHASDVGVAAAGRPR